MKAKTTNLEIYNYLNITNKRLGSLYKLSGYSPLPADFSFDTETIKERLYLNQMSDNVSYPEFLFEEKNGFKKRLILSVKRIKLILKQKKYQGKVSQAFEQKFETYLLLRQELTEIIIKKFSKVDFDESEAYAEICALNPIFFDSIDGIFESEFNFEEKLENFENKYQIYYSEKLKKLEEKNTKKQKNVIENNLINEKIIKNIKENKNIQIKKEIKSQKILKSAQIAKIKEAKIEKKEKQA